MKRSKIEKRNRLKRKIPKNQVVGYLTQCKRCGCDIDVWDWKKGDPIPEDVICEECLTPKELKKFKEVAK